MGPATQLGTSESPRGIQARVGPSILDPLLPYLPSLAPLFRPCLTAERLGVGRRVNIPQRRPADRIRNASRRSTVRPQETVC